MKWGTVIPLLGGMTLGNKEATGVDPSFCISWDAFAANDANLRKRMPEVPFYMVNEEGKFQNPDIDMSIFEGVDFVSSVCPCAGLSMLNAGTSIDSEYGRGSNAVQNQWMYKSTNFVLEHVKPKVLWGENAPGLYTDLGKGVRENLINIAEKFGYAFSIVKTNTKLHGIPQNRPRSFYFFWKAETSPILNWYNRPRKNVAQYLAEVPRDTQYFFEERCTNLLLNDPFYHYMLEEFGADYRKIMKERNANSFFNLIQESDKGFQGCIDYLESRLLQAGISPEGACPDADEIAKWEKAIKNTKHMMHKLSIGKGYWNWSTHYFDEVTNATVSRNMDNTLHPTEERIFTLREYMHMMGLPHDFELVSEKDWNHIAQNVPVCTARDYTYEVMKFCNGGLKLSNVNVLMQENNAQRIDTKGVFIQTEASEFIAGC